MYSAVCLSCKGKLAITVQKNANQRAIVSIQLGPMFIESVGNHRKQVLRASHRHYQQRLSVAEIVKVCTLLLSAIILRSSASS